MYDLDLRPWSRLAALVVTVLLLMALYAEVASAQQALPYSATNIPISAGSPTFTVNLNMLTGPDRPQLHVLATPDASHPNMTLEIQVPEEGCPFFGPNNCPFFGDGAMSSNSAPGAVDWVAPVWQCIPAPHDETVTGVLPPAVPQCTVRVTATSFGSGGSPAHFNLQIQGETKPVTGTAQTVVNPAGGTLSGNLPFDRVNFITDAANFRWIYDAQHDFTVETFQPVSHAQLGSCNINPDEINLGDIFALPYHYTYVGSPSYVGYDCCTWQMDSLDTNTTGSGQALFFVNVGLGNPPPDADNDGFFDPCDNCMDVPNGPFLGTCVASNGSAVGGPCLSDQQCTGGQFCSMAQEDNDFDPAKGLVCLPEPGSTTLLASGVLCLFALERHRRKACVTASC